MFVEAGCDRLERREGPRHRARASGARAPADTLWAKGLGQADRIRARGLPRYMAFPVGCYDPNKTLQIAAGWEAIKPLFTGE